jgi:hypothetical protein
MVWNDANAGGKTGGADAAVVVYNMDVIPAWWGESDAPQAPDLPPVPTADSNCGITTSDTTRQPADVVLVLDRSLSMEWSIAEDCYCAPSTTGGGGVQLCSNTTNCLKRWDAVKSALSTTLSNTQYVNWGLKFFGTDVPTCSETSTLEVPVAANSAAEIQTRIGAISLLLGTPTAAAITAASNYLKTLSDPNKKFILLATDGEPNCGGSPPNVNTVDVTGATDATAAAYSAGFPVYVVGIGPSAALTTLTQLAQKGGTTDYYPADSPEKLAQSLSSISTIIGSCTFTATTEPPDSANVAVYVNKQQIAQNPDNGWTFGANAQEILLTGSYCEQITSGIDTNVQILFGCPGSPPFPTYIP